MMRQAFDTQPAYSSSSSCLSSSRRPRIANFFEDGASTDFHRRPTSLERNWELLRSAIDKAFSGYDDLASLSASSRAAIKNKQALYMSVEELVLEGYSQPLLVRLFAYLDEKVSHVVTSLYQHLRTVQDLSFLGIVAASWTAFLRSLHEVVQVFSYLERHVVAYTPDSSIVEVAESMWLRHQGQCGADFNSTLLNFILEAIRLHRTGDHTWEEALRTVIRMLFTLGLYTKALQPRLLEASSLFYREEGDHLTKEMSLVDYACHVEKRLIEEDSRVDAFLVPPSREPLLDVVRKHLIEDHEDFLLTIDVLKQLTKNRETLHLRRLYILFSQIDALDLLKTRFLETVKVMGLELLESLQKASSSSSSGGGATTGGRQEREEEEEEEEGGGVSRKDDVESSSEGNRTAWVGRLLDLKETHDVVWATAFCQNQEFHLGIKETWEKFLNQDVSAMKLVTRLLAKRCDILLKGGLKGLDAVGVEHEMFKIMVVFRYLDGKDYFEGFYRTDLCKRLLLKKSASDDAELSMVQKLKDECGQAFTSRLESMFKDIALSKQLMEDFSKEATKKSEEWMKGLDVKTLPQFDVAVCASGVWPQTAPKEVYIYPPLAGKLHEEFQTFYTSKHAGRALSWIPHLGVCEIKANFNINRPVGSGRAGTWPPFGNLQNSSSSLESEGVQQEMSSMDEQPSQSSSSSFLSASPFARQSEGEYTFKVSEFQAWILLLFNNRDVMAAEEVGLKTGLSGDELQRQLIALYVNKATRILLRHKTETADEYAVNFDFHSKLKRMQVAQIQLSTQPKEELEKAEAHVAQDRNHQIDACIVRIMKAKKELHHNPLMSIVLTQLSFKCDLPTLKKRTESLITREYLKRDDSDHTLYRYVA